MSKGGGGQTPITPFDPPVSASHWNTKAQTICAKASVSIARYTPESRTANQPNSNAPASATSGAATSARPIGTASHFTSSAAP